MNFSVSGVMDSDRHKEMSKKTKGRPLPGATKKKARKSEARLMPISRRVLRRYCLHPCGDRVDRT